MTPRMPQEAQNYPRRPQETENDAQHFGLDCRHDRTYEIVDFGSGAFRGYFWGSPDTPPDGQIQPWSDTSHENVVHEIGKGGRCLNPIRNAIWNFNRSSMSLGWEAEA